MSAYNARRTTGASSIGGSSVQFSVSQMQAPGFLVACQHSKRNSTGEDIDLKMRLRALCQWLQGLDQDYPTENLNEVSKQLVERQLLKHNDKDVRMLVACCIVDILRIYAPDAPYSDVQLKDSFEVIIAQLRELNQSRTTEESTDDLQELQPTASARYELAFYLLESLATVKSCILLVHLATKDSNYEGYLLDLFECLLETIQPNMSTKVEAFMVDVILACIDEMEEISQSILSCILKRTLPKYKNQNPAAYSVSKQVISRAADRLQPPISELVNAVLITGDGSTTESDIRDKQLVFDIVYELHLISPQLLLYVIPAVTQELLVDDADVRLAAVHLLGDLYSSEATCLGNSYAKQFSQFCERFHDVDADVRLHVVAAGGRILSAHSQLVTQLEPHLKKRLLDYEKSVRLEAVRAICDAAAASLSSVSMDLLVSVGDRTHDKVPDVRKEAATGLSQAFGAHIPALWEGCLENYSVSAMFGKNTKKATKGNKQTEDLDETVLDIRCCIPLDGLTGTTAEDFGVPGDKYDPLKKLCWVPSAILSMYTQPEADIRQRMLQLLDHILLPQKLSEEGRSRGIMQLYVSLDDSARSALKAVFRERARNQKLVNTFLSSRSQRGKDSSGEDRLAWSIEQLAGSQTKAKENLRHLSTMKDQRIFHRMKTMANVCSTAESLTFAKTDLFERVGNKSNTVEVLKPLWRKTAMHTVTIDMIPHLARIMARCIETTQFKRGEFDVFSTESLGLIDDLSSFFPNLLKDTLDDFLQLLPRCKGPQLEVLVRIYANLSTQIQESGSVSSLESSLKDIILLETDIGDYSWCIKVVKHATRAFIKLSHSSEDALRTLFNAVRGKNKLMTLTDTFEKQFRIDQEEHDTVMDSESESTIRGSDGSKGESSKKPFVLLVSRLVMLSELLLCDPSVAVGELPQLLDTLQKDIALSPLRQHSASNIPSSNKPTVKLQAVDGSVLHCPKSSVWLDQRFCPHDVQDVTWSGAARAMATKCMVNVCRGIAKYYSARTISSDEWILSREETNDVFRRIVEALCKICETDGQPLSGCELRQPDSSLLKIVASQGLTRIAASTPFDSFCTQPRPLVSVGECLIDKEVVVRHSASRLLVKLFSNGSLKPIFLSWLSLSAADSSKDVKQPARSQLRVTIPKYRKLYSTLVERNNNSDESVQPRLAQMSPDYSFPVLLYILSHLSNFPPESAWTKYAVDKDLATSAFKFQLCCLSELVVPLTARPLTQGKSNTGAPDSLSFLMHMATVILNCEDASYPPNKRIFACANLAQQILKNKLRRADQVSTIAPQVCLPTNLFKQRSSKNTTGTTPTAHRARFEVNVGDIKTPPSRNYIQGKQHREQLAVSQTQSGLQTSSRSSRKARRRLVPTSSNVETTSTLESSQETTYNEENETGCVTAVSQESSFGASPNVSHNVVTGQPTAKHSVRDSGRTSTRKKRNIAKQESVQDHNPKKGRPLGKENELDETDRPRRGRRPVQRLVDGL
eukprot:gb/GECG01009413.1/.p1 GENE.gb/GECG01009413.1/~~gb/GECG01009413.1/.p1  ORF type:complete len:1491 (+),score=198.69 gb/GECG01009413.1/:1-4473(+)